ncbi:hypothetical protein EDB87DRAFT_535160 [Lactarius vividus]|nr:hypothetical protein EDB87DRAFT_535160 [Lactarius vividus]
MSVSSSTLLTLPVEIILAILEDCEYQEILACKLTCRRMYDTISGSISLRYLLELAANGMRDDHRSSLGKTQRLNLLAEHETAWRTLSWSDNASIDTARRLGRARLCIREYHRLPQCEREARRVPRRTPLTPCAIETAQRSDETLGCPAPT